MTGVTTSKTNPLNAKIDFTNVSEGSGIRPKHLPEGEYRASIKNVEAKTAKSGTPQWVFHIQLDSHPSAVYPYYCGLVAEQAWKIRAVLAGCGITVPKAVKSINAQKLIGKKLGVVLEDDEYEGKMKSVIADIIPASEVAEVKRKAKAPIEDDDDDDLADDDDATDEAAAPADDEDDDELDLDDL